MFSVESGMFRQLKKRWTTSPQTKRTALVLASLTALSLMTSDSPGPRIPGNDQDQLTPVVLGEDSDTPPILNQKEEAELEKIRKNLAFLSADAYKWKVRDEFNYEIQRFLPKGKYLTGIEDSAYADITSVKNLLERVNKFRDAYILAGNELSEMMAGSYQDIIPAPKVRTAGEQKEALTRRITSEEGLSANLAVAIERWQEGFISDVDTFLEDPNLGEIASAVAQYKKQFELFQSTVADVIDEINNLEELINRTPEPERNSRARSRALVYWSKESGCTGKGVLV